MAVLHLDQTEWISCGITKKAKDNDTWHFESFRINGSAILDYVFKRCCNIFDAEVQTFFRRVLSNGAFQGVCYGDR